MVTIEQLTERVRELEIYLDNMRIFNVPQRVICELLKLSERNKLSPATHALAHTKTVLALRVGIENETLSRAIQRLPEYGITINGKTVTIDDPKMIMKKVCELCAGRWDCKAAKYAIEKGR